MASAQNQSWHTSISHRLNLYSVVLKSFVRGEFSLTGSILSVPIQSGLLFYCSSLTSCAKAAAALQTPGTNSFLMVLTQPNPNTNSSDYFGTQTLSGTFHSVDFPPTTLLGKGFIMVLGLLYDSNYVLAMNTANFRLLKTLLTRSLFRGTKQVSDLQKSWLKRLPRNTLIFWRVHFREASCPHTLYSRISVTLAEAGMKTGRVCMPFPPAPRTHNRALSELSALS